MLENIGVILVIFLLIILAFIGFCIYGLFMQSSVKRARQVSARVLSCEKKLVTGKDEIQFVYYLVTVDFYGPNGEKIVKTFKSKKSYEEGETICSRYQDKTECLWPDADSMEINRNSARLWSVIIFFAVFFAIVLIVVYMKFSGDEQTAQLNTIFGYIISIVFIGIGIMGIRKKLELKRSRKNMYAVSGTQADYYCDKRKQFGEADIYYPIYEFTWNGELRRYQSRLGSSNKKYRTIGRKVQMLIEPETEKIICKEDEQSIGSIYFIFGFIGLLVLCIMLAGSFGFL